MSGEVKDVGFAPKVGRSAYKVTGPQITQSSSTAETVADPESQCKSSNPRKTRLVRITRDINGVETSRTYADTAEETKSKSAVNERIPLSPLKSSGIHLQTNRNGIETRQVSEDLTNYGYNECNATTASTPIKKSVVRVRRNSNGVDTSATTITSMENSSNKVEEHVSPMSKRIVRVRRNSLGVEIGRTYNDVTDENCFKNSNDIPSHTQLTTIVSENSNRNNDDQLSPTKTRLVRVRRNSNGIETSRTYVDAPSENYKNQRKKVNGDKDHQNPSKEAFSSPVSSPIRNPKKFSPGKIASPSKMMSQRAKFMTKIDSMKALDLNDTVNTIVKQDEEVKKRDYVESGTEKGIGDNSKNITNRKKGISSQDDPNPHFVGSPPNRSKSMMTATPAVAETQEDDGHVQSLRLLRILLGEELATVCKENVDRALEKHADLLRFQLQQKKKLKQKDESIAYEQKQQEEMKIAHLQQIAKLTDDLKNQQKISQTSLEIKDVEIDILRKECDQKTVKIQQISWRLAKERLAAKNKLASSTSFSPPSDHISPPNEGTFCIRCQTMALDKDESESSFDVLSLNIPAKVIDDDELSEATPVMGYSTSNMVIISKENPKIPLDTNTKVKSQTPPADLEQKLADTENALRTAKKSILLLEKKNLDMEADFEETLCESKAKINQLKAVLAACNERRRVAEQMLRDTGKYDEAALIAISKKSPDELMADISDRGVISLRKNALNEAGASSSVSTTELLKQQNELEMLRNDLAKALSQHSKLLTEKENIANQLVLAVDEKQVLHSQISHLNEQKKQLEDALVNSNKKTENGTEMSGLTVLISTQEALESSTRENSDLENQLNELTQTLKQTTNKNAELEVSLASAITKYDLAEVSVQQHKNELDEARLLLQQSESMIIEYSSRLSDANDSIQSYTKTVSELTTKLEEFSNALNEADEKENRYLAQIAAAHEELHTTSCKLDKTTAMSEETKIALQMSELQVQECMNDLTTTKAALFESEAMAEKYLAMLEEANTTLEQSETLLKQYDRQQSASLIEGENDSNSEIVESESDEANSDDDGTDVSEELSSKTTEDLLAYAAKRLQSTSTDRSIRSVKGNDGVEKTSGKPEQAPIGPVNNKESSDFDESSSVTSAIPFQEAKLIKKWESSRQQHEYISKIANLETELTERQLQLNDALRKISELTSENESNEGRLPELINNELITKASAEIAGLKQQVETTEAKYNEAMKKLLYLKETVLSVVDAI